ncbi:hypothetical protein SAMN06265795_108125 [Noviherbaspirillum humi]|uniref:Uncharacterized protein n=1 Tax=Noviherbaspirillum humi TaxID=1688639 RepID=A0A239I8D7_9BURK|nr:hypothetical protein SAMN06265795_108125 [Noviherbaspirillum humi]
MATPQKTMPAQSPEEIEAFRAWLALRQREYTVGPIGISGTAGGMNECFFVLRRAGQSLGLCRSIQEALDKIGDPALLQA